MDNPLTPEQQNAVIEEALRTYPVMPMPRDIILDVTARIRTAPALHPFRLAWNDFVLSAVLALCILAVWFSLQQLPALVVAQLRKESILFYQQILLNAPSLFPLLSFGFAGILAALTLPYLGRELRKYSEPGSRIN
jgi:hypothetical protein